MSLAVGEMHTYSVYTSSRGCESSGERASHMNSSKAKDTDIPALIFEGRVTNVREIKHYY